MAKIGYNPLEGILRLARAGQKKPDPFVTDVLVYHAALEQEIDVVLQRLLCRPEKLFQRSGQFGFQNKVTLLSAAWIGDPESGDRICDALIRFNDLRNAVAHNDQSHGREKALRNLHKAFRLIDRSFSQEPSVLDIATGICVALADGEILDGLSAIRIKAYHVATEVLPTGVVPDEELPDG